MRLNLLKAEVDFSVPVCYIGRRPRQGDWLTREFSARVPEEEVKKFLAHTDGIYGATTWFINTALRAFNEEMEKNPGKLRDVVQQSVRSFTREREESVA